MVVYGADNIRLKILALRFIFLHTPWAPRHDVTQLELGLDEIIIDRPDPKKVEQNLYTDKGYTGEPALKIIEDRNYIAHVKTRGEEIFEKKANPGYRARRWVVKVSHSWSNRFRKILVCYEKLSDSYQALLHMTAAIIAFRKAGVIYGQVLIFFFVTKCVETRYQLGGAFI